MTIDVDNYELLRDWCETKAAEGFFDGPPDPDWDDTVVPLNPYVARIVEVSR